MEATTQPRFTVGYADSWFRDRYGSQGAKVHAVEGAKGYRGEQGHSMCGVAVTTSRLDFERTTIGQCQRCARRVASALALDTTPNPG